MEWIKDEMHVAYSIAFLSVMTATRIRAEVIGPADYCMLDSFEPNCNDGEVIMMESALYGRMKGGKCIPENEGNFGCYSDVLSIVDFHCSGKRTCSISPLNRDIVSTKPCPGAGFVGYISTAYKCVQGVNTKKTCASSNQITVAQNSGFIAPPQETSQNCLIVLQALSGRLINFSIYNFMKSTTHSACYEVAVLKEKDNSKSVHVCPSDKRMKEVYKSSGHDVAIELSDLHQGSEKKGSYLIYFEATGCPQPTIPSNSHLERDGDTAKIKCNDSDNSWFIYCKENKWTDHPRKCPEKAWTISKMFKTDKDDFPYGIFLTSFIAVGIGIFLGGFLLFLAINAFQRHQRRLRRAYEAPPIIPDPDYKIYDTCKMDLNFIPGFSTAGRNTIARHQMSPPPVPSQPPEDERRFSRHTYEKPKYNSTDNSPFVEA